MIYGTRLRQAREYCGLTQAELADLLKRDQSLIAHIENGGKEPSDDLLDAIAEHTKFPVSFFARPPDIELPAGSLIFRAHSSLTRKEALEAHRLAEVVFIIGIHLAHRVEAPKPSIQGRSEVAEEAARKTRMSLGLPVNAPIPRLIRTLEKKAGVWFLPLPDLEGRDAFSGWAPYDGYDIPVISISTGRPGDRLRFSVAHELGHLVLHKNLPLKGVSEIENEADIFASEFLMPKGGIYNDLLPPLTLTKIARLKPKWGVSMQALIVRAKSLDLISQRQYRYLFQQLTARGWRDAEPGNLDVSIEKPRLIAKMAEVAYGSSAATKIAAAVHLAPAAVQDILSHFAKKEDFRDEPTGLDGKIVKFPAKQSH
jgi:Zn-dependent peptidase ImmA (M78 family)/DNA-binding XRE family transcriptional regulator